MDRYGGVLGVVYLDGRVINLEMVKAGLAEVYRGKMRQDFNLIPYHAAEKKAGNFQKGIWCPGTIGERYNGGDSTSTVVLAVHIIATTARLFIASLCVTITVMDSSGDFTQLLCAFLPNVKETPE